MLCFRKFPVAKKIMDKKEVSRFSLGKFCLTVPEIFVGEHFCAVFQKKFGREKLFG